MSISKKEIESSVKDKELIEIRRKEIVNAAVDLFVRKGFHRTTIREIAQKFGMSIGTLYEYIRTKEDILILVCDYINSTVRMRVKPSVEITKDSAQSLINAIEIYYRIIDELQDNIIFLYQETKSLSHENRKYIFKSEEDMTHIFEDILKHGVEQGNFKIEEKNIPLTAHNIMVLGQMWAFRRWALQKNYTLDRYIETQSKTILDQISAR
ncbi:MAG: TetR/AcrR family transcriptional regulator [Thermodesulfobacteriota bacterium]